jgi:hypothetical protein
MSAKKKAAPKKAAPKKVVWVPFKDAERSAPKNPDFNDAFIRRAIANGATVSEMTVNDAADKMEEYLLRGYLGIPKHPGPDLFSIKPRLRIGSIVRHKEENLVMIVLWRDNNEFERHNEPDPKARYSWGGPCLSDPLYGWDAMWASDKQLEDGEIEIIGHFDFFGLVNGNNNR